MRFLNGYIIHNLCSASHCTVFQLNCFHSSLISKRTPTESIHNKKLFSDDRCLEEHWSFYCSNRVWAWLGLSSEWSQPKGKTVKQMTRTKNAVNTEWKFSIYSTCLLDFLLLHGVRTQAALKVLSSVFLCIQSKICKCHVWCGLSTGSLVLQCFPSPNGLDIIRTLM